MDELFFTATSLLWFGGEVVKKIMEVFNLDSRESFLWIWVVMMWDIQSW